MSELRYININEIYPHPDNPRKNVGDVTELAESIKANGILQNLTVITGHYMSEEEYVHMATAEGATKSAARVCYTPKDWFEPSGYTVIIGHRRLAAAKQAGLTELPCIVREMTPQEQVKTMLMENIQRSDLTVYEQAQGFQMMLDMGETVESIAKDSGFSKTTVRRRVKLLDLDAEKFRKSEARGATLQDYMELEKIDDPELKNKALDAIGTVNFRNELKSAIEADRIKKRMATWRTDIEAFATEIEKRDYVGEKHVPMDYVRNYGRWSGDVSVEYPADHDTVRYYFRVSENQIDLYKDHQEKEETEEDRRRREIAAELKHREAEMQEITERHFGLRWEFVSEFSKCSSYLQKICQFASDVIVGDGEYVCDELNYELLADLLDLDVGDTDYATLKAMVAVESAKNPVYVLLASAYARMDDEDNKYWWKRWNSDTQKYGFVYEPNDELDRLYEFLISLGYEMSDEEKAMQNGDHELFDKPEAK